MTSVAIIDYGMGNLHSVSKAFEKVGAQVAIISQPDEGSRFERLVLPGVGSLGDCMKGLEERGFCDWIRDWITSEKPFLGVCLGFQALFEASEENDAKGLGVFSGKAERFKLPHEYKIPHMGWNAVKFTPTNGPMDLELIRSDQHQFYFDHSYYVIPRDLSIAWGETTHGDTFVSAVSSGRTFATQFHPEKSQAIGLQIYENFLNV